MSGPPPAGVDRPRRFFARYYASLSPRLDAEGLDALRAELLAGLDGEVVEVGAGNGRNFGHYPGEVSRVVAVEPEPYLRALAVEAAAHAPVTVDVRAGVAERLPLPDAGVDAAVLCLVMCSLPERARALAELRRVLRPGATLRFLEHTLAETRALRTVQRVADATLWPRLAGGCHTATDPVAAIVAAGFEILDSRRLRFPPGRFTQPSSPHVLGTARAPR